MPAGRPHPGDVGQLRCDALDDRGAGVGTLSDLRLHIAGALEGETVQVTIEHLSPHGAHGWGRLDGVVEASPLRVRPVCPAHGSCGGCPLQHLSYEAQVRWKTQLVANALAQAPALRGVATLPCVPAPRPLGYRNQAKYVYGAAPGGPPVLGAYLPRSHRLVDMAGCRVLEAPLDAVAGVIRERAAAHGLPPYDERTRAGLLRHVVARANATGEVLVTLVTAHDRWADARAFADEIRAAAPAVIGVVQNVNATPGNQLYGDDERPLAGRSSLKDAIGSTQVELSSRSFFQLNRDVAALAYDAIRSAAAGVSPGCVVDAYAGAGGIAFTLAPIARRVVAIEQNGAATAAAAAFARLRGEERVRFVTGDVAEHLTAVGAADVVVLNPPRAGCARQVLAATAGLRPRMVAYLSCNPDSLVRDLVALAGHGLATRTVTPYDMLPHTAHVEALALLAPAQAP